MIDVSREPEMPRVIFEDNHLLVVDKPAGMLSQGDRSGDPSLVDWAKSYLAEKYRKPGNVYIGLVHRLDRPVGGVIVLARTSKAAGRLSQSFRTRDAVRKVYRAIVEGRIEPAEAELREFLKPGRGRLPTQVVPSDTPGAQAAALRYRVLASRADSSLLEITLLTGRKHQIRAQLGHLGYPIVGDRRYGSTGGALRHRIALQASELSVPHPIGGTPMHFAVSAPLTLLAG